MLEHIRFCLDEIECEIEAYEVIGLSTVEQADLREHIALMRDVLDRSELRRSGRFQRPKPSADDLTLIRGIDSQTADDLHGFGIRRFADIANLTRADIDALSTTGIDPARIGREGWIEQAAILATGELTHHASHIKAGTCASLHQNTWCAPARATAGLADVVAHPANDETDCETAARHTLYRPRHAAAVFLGAVLAGLQSSGFPGIGN